MDGNTIIEQGDLDSDRTRDTSGYGLRQRQSEGHMQIDADHVAQREAEIRSINVLMQRLGPSYSLGGDPYFPGMYPIIYAKVQAQLDNPQPASEYDSDNPDEPEYNLENPAVLESNEENQVVPKHEEDPMEDYDTEGDEDGDDDVYFPMAPINALIDWDVENEWNAMHQEPFVPLTPPPPVEEVEEEPHSDVEDGPPPPPPSQEVVYYEGPSWIPWIGHHADYRVNQRLYINVPNLYPCSWKQLGGPFYFGPVTLLSDCEDGYYSMAAPHGFCRHVAWTFPCHCVSHRRPEAKHRIIPLNSNFNNRRFYDEGTRTVTQYAARFEELVRHAGDLIKTDDAKSRRFEWGLDTSMRGTVMSHDFKTYAQNNNRGYVAKPYYQNNSRPQQQNQLWGSSGLRQGQNQAQNRNKEPVRYFNCQELGHYRSNCPKPPKEGNNNMGNQLHKQIGYGNQNQGGPNHQRSNWNQQQNCPYLNNGNGQGANQGQGDAACS
ncbi:hypothetical protein Vadar_003814 [Vaccinium darrowii]|uniref:Uncharacterized protein n=1 Tax=Vaccinium darrowii TaxID=229202 RepID=A0ACB7XN30_9ERIC|nr:hypothetical protein Vadar_003814 [Vaccinium darrowii]